MMKINSDQVVNVTNHKYEQIYLIGPRSSFTDDDEEDDDEEVSPKKAKKSSVTPKKAIGPLGQKNDTQQINDSKLSVG